MDAPRLQIDKPSALPAGTRLGEFELRGLLGIGGFGIVYLAFDHALEREVAVKEYMPSSLAGRTETMHVSLRSQADAETFALGLKSFVNEARLLARFDHPSLLKVHRFWQANNTAYMAMPVLRGRTVKAVREGLSAPPDEAWMRALLDPLLGAIEALHAEGVYHRDIAPDNIQIEPGGRPVLLDFGAARRVIVDKSQTLTAILKPSYAPIEQYAEVGSVRQGPWTDIYALGATLHFVLLGRPPAPATARTIHDEPSQLTADAAPGCSDGFLRTIDWMLAPRPGDRPQSVAALRDVLEGRAPAPRRRAPAAPVDTQWDRTVLLQPAAAVPASRPVATAMATPVADEATALHVPAFATGPAPVPLAASAVEGVRQPSTRGMRMPLALGIGAVLATVLAAALLWPRAAPVPAAAVAAPGTAAPAASEVVVALPAAVPAALAEPPAIASPATASRIAEVAVPGAERLPAGQGPAGTASQPARLPPRLTADGRRPPPRATAPLPGAVATGPAAAASAAPTATRPAALTDPAPPSATAPAPVPAATSTVAAGPESTCAGRNPVMHFVCMERECLRSELGSHGDCLKWRKEARRD